MVDKKELFAGYYTVWNYAVNRLGYEVHEGPDMQDVCMSIAFRSSKKNMKLGREVSDSQSDLVLS